MSLTKPDAVRTLQRKLYIKAKAEPEFRFYQLYDKVWRDDFLAHAYALARSNAGASGVDGETFEQIEERGSEKWLAGLREELRSKTYRSQPVRRVMIPKPNGGERALGIPTIRDRVVQTAVKLVIEPIFEADLEPNTYGYRPQRSANDAIEKVHKLLIDGYTPSPKATKPPEAAAALPRKCGGRRPVEVLRHDPARRTHELRCAPDRGPDDLEPHQDVAEGTGRGNRQGREEADVGRQGKQDGNTARGKRLRRGWGHLAVAGQSLHQPLPETLAHAGEDGGVPRPRGLLCRRLRHPQPRSRGGGAGVDTSCWMHAEHDAS